MRKSKKKKAIAIVLQASVSPNPYDDNKALQSVACICTGVLFMKGARVFTFIYVLGRDSSCLVPSDVQTFSSAIHRYQFLFVSSYLCVWLRCHILYPSVSRSTTQQGVTESFYVTESGGARQPNSGTSRVI